MLNLNLKKLEKEQQIKPTTAEEIIKIRAGAPGWHSGWASAFGPGRDPGVMGSSPSSGSSAMSLLLPLPLPLLVFPLSLAVSISVK